MVLTKSPQSAATEALAVAQSAQNEVEALSRNIEQRRGEVEQLRQEITAIDVRIAGARQQAEQAKAHEQQCATDHERNQDFFALATSTPGFGAESIRAALATRDRSEQALTEARAQRLKIEGQVRKDTERDEKRREQLSCRVDEAQAEIHTMQERKTRHERIAEDALKAHREALFRSIMDRLTAVPPELERQRALVQRMEEAFAGDLQRALSEVPAQYRGELLRTFGNVLDDPTTILLKRKISYLESLLVHWGQTDHNVAYPALLPIPPASIGDASYLRTLLGEVRTQLEQYNHRRQNGR